jgi:hypothetical protein
VRRQREQQAADARKQVASLLQEFKKQEAKLKSVTDKIGDQVRALTASAQTYGAGLQPQPLRRGVFNAVIDGDVMSEAVVMLTPVATMWRAAL